jgi:hypothetical protein
MTFYCIVIFFIHKVVFKFMLINDVFFQGKTLEIL